jgi:ribosomal protein L11 methyltransferase
MHYLAFHFDIEPLQTGREILVYELGEVGFDSFVETENGLDAFIPEDQYHQGTVEEILPQYAEAFKAVFTIERIEQKNWNAEWESNFHPIEVNDQCLIRAPFHEPQDAYAFQLVIRPQMSFGTGHHETTWLMARRMFALELKGKSVLDMGCGTGVLAILASKMGASPVTAIDNDEWSYLNTIENAELNNTSPIIVEKGDAALLAGRHFQVILANINRNVLIADMPSYVRSLSAGGTILFSGIFVTDEPLIRSTAEGLGLIFEGMEEKNNWVVLQFKKN